MPTLWLECAVSFCCQERISAFISEDWLFLSWLVWRIDLYLSPASQSPSGWWIPRGSCYSLLSEAHSIKTLPNQLLAAFGALLRNPPLPAEGSSEGREKGLKSREKRGRCRAWNWRKAPWLPHLHLDGAEVPELHQTCVGCVGTALSQDPVNIQRLKGHKKNSSKPQELCQDPLQTLSMMEMDVLTGRKRQKELHPWERKISRGSWKTRNTN